MATSVMLSIRARWQLSLRGPRTKWSERAGQAIQCILRRTKFWAPSLSPWAQDNCWLAGLLHTYTGSNSTSRNNLLMCWRYTTGTHRTAERPPLEKKERRRKDSILWIHHFKSCVLMRVCYFKGPVQIIQKMNAFNAKVLFHVSSKILWKPFLLFHSKYGFRGNLQLGQTKSLALVKHTDFWHELAQDCSPYGQRREWA